MAKGTLPKGQNPSGEDILKLDDSVSARSYSPAQMPKCYPTFLTWDFISDDLLCIAKWSKLKGHIIFTILTPGPTPNLVLLLLNTLPFLQDL